MGTFRKRRAVGRCLACAALALACVSASAAPSADPWTVAVAARARFEAQASHTRPDYAQVMNGFRAIYHADPKDPHAPAAVAQVAELLAEQGRELNDPKSLTDAAGQCSFLEKGYPASSVAHTCRVKVEAAAKTPEKPAEAVAASVPTEEPTPRRAAAASSTSGGTTAPTARVTGIRHWSTPSYTRVAIDLGDEVQYEAPRVQHPNRIFFDLHHAHLAPELAGKSFAITDDGFLTRIRAAQSSDDVTRVVLDVHDVVEYSAFLLPNPYRLIIDIHGKAGNRKPEVGNGVEEEPAGSAGDTSAAALPSPPATAEKAAAASAAKPQSPGAASGSSSLPPMPVTDGSAAFGLPAKTSSKVSSETAATRVVIPTKPTAARPVPNTVTSKSATTSTEVAAVSEQPGKVEATDRPTSAPVADRAQSAGLRVQKTRAGTGADSPTPVAAAPPTADGSTSLVRALGLKIGRIVIDAGHGGHDSGTLGAGGIEEKDVVLDVALRLGRLLHQRLGAEIVYTRADDTFIPLETRTAIANKAQADLFISVHANSSQDATARGVEVYYLNFTSDPEAMRVAGRENAVSTQSVHELSDLVKKIALKDKIDESKELAADVDESLFAGLTRGNQGLKNRGVKKAPFVVLIGANMPSILAEISFVTNPSDAAQLRTPDYRERVAESLYTGVAHYAAAINGPPAPHPPRLSLQRAAAKR